MTRGEPRTCQGCLSAGSCEPRLRMLVANNSESVVMKVDNRQGMCNNSPAKATSSENEWRSRVSHSPSVSATLTVEVALSLDSHRDDGFKAETPSCRGIPRCTFPPLGGGRSTGALWQRPRPWPPWTQIWVAVAAIRTSIGRSMEPVGRPECGGGFPANSSCVGVSRPLA